MKTLLCLAWTGLTFAQTIDPEALRADVAFLASRELHGRKAPSEELDRAAEFVQTRFERMGLVTPPGGYFQNVPIRGGASRNVLGILLGSDGKLKGRYVIVSAHYDHLGQRGGETYLGANDDASGTAGVLEISASLAAMPTKPKRSILFAAFCCEEAGLVGSRYFATHPVIALDHVDGQLNLEQIGRTDAIEGTKVAEASVTGFSFSDLPARIRIAASEAGIEIRPHPEGDYFFRQSDNLPLAVVGIPAHTLFVAAQFPDYHKPGDSWEKLDYGNMAMICRAAALGVLRLADEETPPQWNAANRAAKPYVKANRALHEH